MLLLYVPVYPGESEPKISTFYRNLILKEVSDDHDFRLEKIPLGDWKKNNPKL